MRRLLTVIASTAMVALVACGSSGGKGPSAHTYQGAASVGDFLSIAIDPSAKKITYRNITNGDTGTVSYAPRADGGMDVSDPNGDIVQCYELPGVALVCSGSSLGPTGAKQPALLYGVIQATLTKNDMKNAKVGYLQFRTREGGIELGHVSYDINGDGAGGGYFPVNLVLPLNWYGKAQYTDLAMASSQMADNTTLGTVDWTEPGTQQVNHIFGTAGGNFMVDSPNGALFAFRDTAAKDFNPANAGTYTALVYSKGVSYVAGTETAQAGSPRITTATVTIGVSGTITVTQNGATVMTSTLLPFEGSPWQGTGRVVDPVHGLFYFPNANDASSSYGTPPVFVTFFDHALAFAEFNPKATGDFIAQPQVPAQYSYTYGIAVKTP